MKYDKALVDGGFQLNSILSFLKSLAIELFPFLVKDEYYYNRIHRKFNPRKKFNDVELKYQESDNIGVNEYLGRIHLKIYSVINKSMKWISVNWFIDKDLIMCLNNILK